MAPPESRVFGRSGNRQALNCACQYLDLLPTITIRSVRAARAAQNGDVIMKSATCFDNDFEPSISCGTNVYPISREVPRRAFLTVSWLLFAVCAMVTVLWCNSMSAMGEMPMPGGWTMSMTWMRMPGQSWLETTALFLAMWVVMMAAMMLPSLAPMLLRYRQAVGWAGESRLGRLTAVAGLGYFFVWTLSGLVVFPLGVALATVEMEHPALARAVPAGWVWSLSSPAQFSSRHGRLIALHVAGYLLGLAIRCLRTPDRHGVMACGSESTA